MATIRRKTKVIKIGKVHIGGNFPVAIQSMVKCKVSDTEAAIQQIKRLEKCGCEIVRAAIKDKSDAAALKKIKSKISIPIVADIHFDWHLALTAIENGVDKIRLNPGNIYKKEQIKEVVSAAKMHHIPIRVGLNSGSLPGVKYQVSGVKKGIDQRLVKGALDYIKILEGFGFYDIVISLKASNIPDMVHAYRKMSEACEYPFHLGLTATGLPEQGAIKSSIAVGALLLDGIGDTIRISLTDKPESEIKIARDILQALNLRHFGPEIISCPTCGRCEVDLIKIVRDLESKLSTVNCELSTRPPKVAVMGCVVNGPGEAKEADIGIAFGKNAGLLFKKGKAKSRVLFKDSVNTLLKEIRRINV